MKVLVLEKGKLKVVIENKQEKSSSFVKKLINVKNLDKKQFFNILYDEMPNFTNIELLSDNLLCIDTIEFKNCNYVEYHNIIKLNESLNNGFYFQNSLQELLENYHYNKENIDLEHQKIKNKIISNNEIEMAIIDLAMYYKKNNDMPTMSEKTVRNLRDYFNKNSDKVQNIVKKNIKINYFFNKNIIKKIICDFILIIISISLLMFGLSNFVFRIFNYSVDIDVPLYIFIGLCVYFSASLIDLRSKIYIDFNKSLLRELNAQADKIEEQLRKRYMFNSIYEDENDEVFFDFLKSSKNKEKNSKNIDDFSNLL